VLRTPCRGRELGAIGGGPRLEKKQLRIGNAALAEEGQKPRKKSKNVIPRILCRMLSGEKIIATTSVSTSRFRGIGSFLILSLNRPTSTLLN